MTIRTKYPRPGPPKYSVRYGCANCGWSGTVTFDKGKRAPDTTTCPTCEVSGAKKSLPYVRTVPKDPIIPLIPSDVPPWPRELPRPWPRPAPYTPWEVPYKPHRPWDVPQQPHFDWRYQPIGIANDTDHSNRLREDVIHIDDFHEGLGFGQ
jgi:hypothetical protein